jgi:spermidine/putrescine transport system substrate-binding protein
VAQRAVGNGFRRRSAAEPQELAPKGLDLAATLRTVTAVLWWFRPSPRWEDAVAPLIRPLTRRRLLRNSGLLAAAAAGAPALAACGTEPVTPASGGEDLSAEEKTLRFDNWPLYIDVDEDDENVRPTLEAFTEETGISVEYVEAINDNDEYFAKISPQLQAGQPIGADVFVVTDWLVARLIGLGWLQELNQDNLPTVAANLDPALQNPGFDPGRVYSVPWQVGITGIAYNARALPEGITAWDQLLTDSSLAGKVTLFSGMRESLPILAGIQGNGVDAFTDADVEAALAAVQAAVANGQVRRFTGNDYVDDLASGNVVAAMAWSGDAFQLQLDDPDITFVIPDEGGELWSDNLVVPVGATHKTNAELLIDYYYRPEVAAQLAAWVNYISPVPAAKKAMADIDAELAESPLIFPTEADLSNVRISREITAEEEQQYESDWNAIVT